MFIVLSNRRKGNNMNDVQNIEAAPAAPEEQQGEVRQISASRRAAAIEAAYILEALRK
jgi:hypothetical protein